MRSERTTVRELSQPTEGHKLSTHHLVVPTVLAIDDDIRLLLRMQLDLARQGYLVVTESTPGGALERVERGAPDLIVVDMGMPGDNGLPLLSRLRDTTVAPIIMLVGKHEQHSIAEWLDGGADDFLIKPFKPYELVSRVRAVLQRRANTVVDDGVIAVADLTISRVRRCVERQGHTVRLTPTEFRLLWELANNRGKVLLHRDLLTRVWGPQSGDRIDYLWTYIRYLRNKIEPDPAAPRYILSQPGVGYYMP